MALGICSTGNIQDKQQNKTKFSADITVNPTHATPRQITTLTPITRLGKKRTLSLKRRMGYLQGYDMRLISGADVWPVEEHFTP